MCIACLTACIALHPTPYCEMRDRYFSLRGMFVPRPLAGSQTQEKGIFLDQSPSPYLPARMCSQVKCRQLAYHTVLAIHGNQSSNMVSKADFKNLFQSSIKEMLTKRETDEESLDMNVFDMFTGKHNEFVSKNYDDSMSITNKLFHFEQTNEPDKCYLKDNNNNHYDEIAYPFSKRIKLKHEPE
jgi:hypothetical protein